MKRILLYTLIVTSVVFTSCNKWLDVKPAGQVTTPDLFSTYGGFCSALNGCYFKLKARDIYGEQLTMSYIESLAQLWRADSYGRPVDYELKQFKYDSDNTRAAFKSIYAGLYNVIAQANMIINALDTYGDVIKDPVSRAIIEGEAYAIRAFCHFDILRLFGQLPQGGTISVSLPYAENVSHESLPSYYSYEDYVAKIESDLNKAESALKDKDPIFKYTYFYLEAFEASASDDIVLDDDFHGYRQHKFNYWAIRALQARFYLYIGKKEKAYTIAREIINAKGADGNPVISLSGVADLNAGYIACPTESLMMLHVYDLVTYTPSLLASGSIQSTSSHLVITQAQLNQMFETQNIAANNRYRSVWGKTLTDPMGTIYPTLMKYYHQTGVYTTNYLDFNKKQVVPLLRLSEMYLIAIETTNDLNEANTLWNTYKLSHNLLLSGNTFNSLDGVRAEIVNEYRREFFGEGQMFYTYKRLNSPAMLWGSAPIVEENYIPALPMTEFNPNK